MVEATIWLDTILGRLCVAARCPASHPTEVALRLDVVDVRTRLPPGMSVSRRRAVLLRVVTADDVPELGWACTLLTDAAGSPCNGEGLVAQEWEGGDRLVTVGTEDHDFLASRSAFLPRREGPGFATYSPGRLEVQVTAIPASSRFSLHYVVAENSSPEPVSASSWFAVDVPHGEVVAML